MESRYGIFKFFDFFLNFVSATVSQNTVGAVEVAPSILVCAGCILSDYIQICYCVFLTKKFIFIRENYNIEENKQILNKFKKKKIIITFL